MLLLLLHVIGVLTPRSGDGKYLRSFRLLFDNRYKSDDILLWLFGMA
jgi:hypothetical protein